ncbi:MAG: hypothetical protein WC141_10725 [Arcobacteraceae bacterium]
MLETLDNIKIRVDTIKGLKIIEIFTKIAESKEPVPVDWLKTLDNYFIVILDNLLSICLSEDYFNRISLQEISADYYIKNNGVMAYKHGTLDDEYIKAKVKELTENNKNITFIEILEKVYEDEPHIRDMLISVLNQSKKGL